MPTIITRGAASTRGFGLLGAGRVIAPDTAIRFKAGNTTLGQQSTTTISLLSGYSAGIYLYMVGDAAAAGSPCCGNCGRSASGEFAQFAYTCTGSETGLTASFNINGAGSANNILRVTVNGGANNGTYAQVGSYNTSCNTYGNTAAPNSQSGSSSGVFSRVTSGAYADGNGNYYDDDYYYGPCGSSYGSGVNGYTADSTTRGQAQGCSNGTTGGVWLQYRNNY
jgi:hypothetical protein